MKAILSADRNWGIGNGNKLLVSIPSDMKFFRQTTTGKVVVMGRKTLESFPNGQPLKNRTNIVLTSNPDYKVKDAVIVHSKEELLKTLEQYDSENIYIIGGESIYRMMLPYCDTVFVTKIDRAFQADTFFPNLDEMEEWQMTEEGEEQTCFDLEFRFTKYERRQEKARREKQEIEERGQWFLRPGFLRSAFWYQDAPPGAGRAPAAVPGEMTPGTESA